MNNLSKAPCYAPLSFYFKSTLQYKKAFTVLSGSERERVALPWFEGGTFLRNLVSAFAIYKVSSNFDNCGVD